MFRDEKVVSAQRWQMSPDGQHIELGIAENNFFILLAALGLAEPVFGARLLPIGTLYDPFIARGLDALNYACYQNARFMLVATPSGITLAPEGGAHQSIGTPLIGMSQDGLTSFEPAFVDELAVLMRWGFEHMQAADGGAVYLRLSTRPVDQPRRALTPELERGIVAGGYWLVPPAPGAELAVVCQGAVAPEAIAAHQMIQEDIPGAGLLAVTSADRLHRGWLAGLRDGERWPCRQPAGGARSRRGAGHACSTAIRRRSPGSVPSPATASIPSASTTSASPAIFPISIGSMALTPMRFWMRRRAPAWAGVNLWPGPAPGRWAVPRLCIPCYEAAPGGERAGVAELVDALDLGSSDASRGGSSPSARTRPIAS